MKKISKSEMIIMEILWENPPLSAAQIVEICQIESAWSDKTIKTFIHRLKEKGAVTTERRDVSYYAPAISREGSAVKEARSLMDERFSGSFKNMAAHFIGTGELEERDILELRDYLDSVLRKKP